MVSLFFVVLLSLAIDHGNTRILNDVQIIWPKLYHFKGEIIDLSVGIIEPFEIWYNTESNTSRLDYYGGTVKRYYFGETEDIPGSEYQIYPITNKDGETTVQCVREERNKPQMNFLIDTSNFTFEESIMYEGKTVQVWKFLEIEMDNEKLLEELYVYRNDENVDILLKREIKKYNLWTGALQKHSITTYFDYTKPSDDDLNIDLVKACNEFSTSDLQVDLNVLHPIVPTDIDKLFHSYKNHHNKNYEAKERKMRKSILEKNWTPRNCGSCWAFSTTAAVEGALARKNGGRDLDLSEQSIVDCAWGFHNDGCDGGKIDTAFNYMLAHGLPTQMEYGNYLAVNGYCNIDNMTDVYTIQGFAHVPASSINALKVALYKYGPVSVAISVDEVMKSYSSGVFFDPWCYYKQINHAVTVVGYGVRDGTTYWIVKNSWGEDWGQDGYILMSATDNNCHILENAYYPVL